VSRTEFPGEFVQRVVADEGAVGHIHRAVVGVELLDGGAAPGRIALAKDLLEVSMEELNNPLSCRRVHLS
jgi:hypothetical protein